MPLFRIKETHRTIASRLVVSGTAGHASMYVSMSMESAQASQTTVLPKSLISCSVEQSFEWELEENDLNG